MALMAVFRQKALVDGFTFFIFHNLVEQLNFWLRVTCQNIAKTANLAFYGIEG